MNINETLSPTITIGMDHLIFVEGGVHVHVFLKAQYKIVAVLVTNTIFFFLIVDANKIIAL